MKDASGNPTGLLRNAAQLLKVVASARPPTAQQQRDAVKHLHHLYNQQGITSICERRTEFEAIDLFRDLARTGELTVRVNCTRLMEPVPGNLKAAVKRLDEMTTGPDGHGQYGPTGVGDDWVRIGPLQRSFLMAACSSALPICVSHGEPGKPTKSPTRNIAACLT